MPSPAALFVGRSRVGTSIRTSVSPLRVNTRCPVLGSSSDTVPIRVDATMAQLTPRVVSSVGSWSWYAGSMSDIPGKADFPELD